MKIRDCAATVRHMLQHLPSPNTFQITPVLTGPRAGNMRTAQVERAERAPSPTPERHTIEELSLDSTFPIEPEVNYRRKNRLLAPESPDFLTDQQVEYYQRENLVCFLCEFAGEVPYKKIPGMYTDRGELKICNMDLIKMAENAYRVTGPGSREEKELTGLYKMLGAVSRGEANRIDIVSPPKIADYMLTFSFQLGDYDPQLGGRPFHEVVSNRPEDMYSLQTSREIYARLARQGGVEDKSPAFQSANDFIAAPIMYNTPDTHSLARSIETIGIDTSEIAFSERFEHEIRTSLSGMMAEYLAQVDTLSYLDGQSNDLVTQKLYNRQKKALEEKRDEIFSFAKRIARELRNPVQPNETRTNIADMIRIREEDPYMFAILAARVREQERAVLTRGTLCPSVNSSGGSTAMGMFAEAGMSPESFFHSAENQKMKDKITINCPSCNCECTYTRKEVARKGKLECKGTMPDGSRCNNAADCWEPFFMVKTA